MKQETFNMSYCTWNHVWDFINTNNASIISISATHITVEYKKSKNDMLISFIDSTGTVVSINSKDVLLHSLEGDVAHLVVSSGLHVNPLIFKSIMSDRPFPLSCMFFKLSKEEYEKLDLK